MMKVRLNGTLDRTRGFMTPAEADAQCPYFRERFFEWGAANERRACCEMIEGQGICDYRLLQDDGTPICARYLHGNQYEVIQDTGENIDDTFEPIPYLETTKAIVQKVDSNGDPLFLDDSVNPPVETTTDTGNPVMVEDYTKRQWLTNQYIDTHEKQFRIRNGVLGWHHEV